MPKESMAQKSARQLKAKGLSKAEIKKRIAADFGKKEAEKIK